MSTSAFKLKYAILVMCSLIFIGFQSQQVVSRDGNTYQYGFFARQENNETSLQIVDFDGDVLTASKRFDIPTLNGLPVQLVRLNTAGTWVAMVFYSPRNPLIKLVNTLSGETRDISTLEVLLGDDVPNDTDQQTIAWSPDSRYLAVIGVNENGRTDIYLYTIETGAITSLTNDPAQQQSMVWSPDSSKIAVLTETCIEGICNTSIDSIDVESRHQIASVMVGQRDELSYNTLICDLEWSPDSHYLTYIDGCDSSIIGNSKMIYLLDWQAQASTSIIDYSNRNDVPSDPTFTILFARYDLFWVDPQNILLGTIFGIGDVFEGKADNETVAYNVSSRKTVLLSKTVGEDWHLKSGSGLIAFRSFRLEALNAFTPLDPEVQIGRFNDNVMKILAEAPAGCDLAWSPVDDILAYADPGQPFKRCSNRIKAIRFLNGTTGKVDEYQIADQDIIFLLGWVVAE